MPLRYLRGEGKGVRQCTMSIGDKGGWPQDKHGSALFSQRMATPGGRESCCPAKENNEVEVQAQGEPQRKDSKP